jgi:flagellar protein FlaJ
MSQRTERNAGTNLSPTVGEAISSVVEAYRILEIDFARYGMLVLFPSVAFFVLTFVIAVKMPFPLWMRIPMPLLGTLVTFTAVIYPKLVVNKRRGEMEDKLHLLITHMTVLSCTNIDRMEVFRTLAEEEEYGELAAEMSRITELVDTWNQSLDDACRRRAQRIPSKPISDFLERLAYTLGAGQSLADFLLAEQDVMIKNYATVYEGSLNNLDVMKDLYLSMILSMTFALVFSTVLPILTGNNPTMTVSAVLVMFGFIQTGFFLVIRTLAPNDPVWYEPTDVSTAVERRLRLSLVVGVALTLGTTGFTLLGFLGLSPVTLDDVVFFLNPIPQPLYAAILVSPMLLPGFVFRREEKRIVERDEQFPSFVRALGATESVKQSTTSKVLESLRKKDFGALTDNVNDLYKRLNMRLDGQKAWRFFSADTRSYLIQKFSEMYLVGRQMGGDPKQLGELISENMNVVNQLRERRKQATVTLIGLLYGITSASAFAFYTGLEVVRILSNMSLDISTSDSFQAGKLIHTEVYNIDTIGYLLLLLILFNALLSSLMIRATDGGHTANGYIHFVAMTWVGSVTAVATQEIISVLFSV